jgi:hypothetical protein
MTEYFKNENGKYRQICFGKMSVSFTKPEVLWKI